MSEPTFSQRMGLKPLKKPIQLGSMNDDLRTGLWNAIHKYYDPESDWYNDNSRKKRLYEIVVQDLFNTPVDDLPSSAFDVRFMIKRYVYEAAWNDVYDLIEFLGKNFTIAVINKQFMDYCNKVLEKESSAYRFVSGRVTQITSKLEIDEIEQAINSPLKTVNTHLETALQLLSDKENPDYRNSVKESISAVESLCQKITGKNKVTLGQALDLLEREGNISLAQSFRQGLDKIYGFSSSSEGIRHGLSDESNLKYEDAKFMLVLCSAFTNYLISKTADTGINLQ